jgi:hypothetical protein
MCATDLDLDLDLDLPEIAADEQAISPDPQPAACQYAGVAWGRAGRHDVPDAARPASRAAPAS